MKIENEASLIEALLRDTNLFLGSGFSLLAKDSSGQQLPTGTILKQELLDFFDMHEMQILNLSQLCTLISSQRESDLRNYLETRLKVKNYDSRYQVLENFSIRSIFTTNIDNLINLIFEHSKQKYLNDVYFRGPIFNDRQAIDLFMLNGSVLDPRRPLRFGALELAQAFRSDADGWRYFEARLSNKTTSTIFWGSSIEDAAILESFANSRSKPQTSADIWAVVHPDSDEGVVAYYRALNFQVIEAGTDEFLDFLTDVANRNSLSAAPSNRTTNELFPQESIPTLEQLDILPPLRNFFLGNAPNWSDIFSGHLHKIKYFRNVRELINNGQNAIIMGVPACGKSTLLMQLASEMPYEGHKLVTESLTTERARSMIRTLSGEQAIIFVDNCVDDIDFFNILSRHSNVRVVGADRDYNLFSVHHRIPQNVEIVSITELDMVDIQSCINTIPPDMRKKSLKVPKIENGNPSLFDIIEANIFDQNISVRFRSLVSDLEKRAPDVLEAILVTSYVHSCRTPVSMDMLLAYWDGIDYRDIYDLVDKAGKTLAEYSGTMDDELQDYYKARSLTIAETIMKEAGPEMKRKMLRRFHENVSPFRIHRYDVFHRRAFDADLFVNAFSNWEEGKEFYQFLYDERDSSPYLLQQAALYLSRMKKYKDAFQMIDRAITVGGRRNYWSIKNSHAIIIFRANANSDEPEKVRDILDESMDILVECHRADKRKLFHALTFAHHSLRYWDIYHDDKARNYLMTANHWLDDERVRFRQSGEINRLQKKINLKLGGF